MGLTEEQRKRALSTILESDPDLLRWRRDVAASVSRNSVSYSFDGRKRILMGFKDDKIRQGYDHPMQGGVSGVFNLTVLEIKRQLPHCVFAWGMHDSQYWHVPLVDMERCKGIMRAIVGRAWTINKLNITFPAKFEVIHRADD
jgi:hypothetical protein